MFLFSLFSMEKNSKRLVNNFIMMMLSCAFLDSLFNFRLTETYGIINIEKSHSNAFMPFSKKHMSP